MHIAGFGSYGAAVSDIKFKLLDCGKRARARKWHMRDHCADEGHLQGTAQW